MAKRSDTLNTTVALRLPDDTVRQLDAMVASASKAAGGIRVTRSDIAREIMKDAIKREARRLVISVPAAKGPCA